MKKINYIAYSPLSKKERFSNAINMIEEYYKQYTSIYKFKVIGSSTTNNYKKFKNETLKNGYITITTIGSSNSIYTHSKFNIIGRFIHDNIHLKYDLDFTVEDEKIVAYKQIEGIEEYATNIGYNCLTIEDAKEIIYHDIISQIKYYEKTNKFVDDQRKFVYSKFLSKGK